MAKKNTRMIPLEKIIQDFNLYPRSSVNPFVVSNYLEALRAGATFPPVEVDQKFRLIDGFHRYEAHKRSHAKSIAATVIPVRNDAEFFGRAIATNARHGNQFSGYDRARMIAKAADLGIQKDHIVSLLSITIESIDSIERGFGHARGEDDSELETLIPLKNSVRHLAGRTLSRRQLNAHQHIGGQQQTFYVNQVLLFLEGNLLDHKNPALMARLYALAQALEKVNFAKYQTG